MGKERFGKSEWKLTNVVGCCMEINEHPFASSYLNTLKWLYSKLVGDFVILGNLSAVIVGI